MSSPVPPLRVMDAAFSSPPRGLDATWLSPPVPPLRGMDSEVSFESLSVAWFSPVLSDVALDVRGGVGVAASPGVWTMPLATGVPVATGGSCVTGADAEAQARESNNNNPAKPNCGALTARFQASRMTSGSFLLVEFIHTIPARLRPPTAGRGVIAVVTLGVGAAVNVGTDERRECSHAKEAVVALASTSSAP